MATFQYLDEGNSEAQDRLATSFLLAQTSPGLATTGVLSGLTVTQTTTASGAVLVAAGAAPVQASVGTGVALLVNDTQATLDVFTANPMGGLPRNDIVAFDSVTKALVAIIGTPNATPDDPTVPATACALARLRHAASATTIPTAKIDSLIVDTRLRGVMSPGLSNKRTSDAGPFSTPESGTIVGAPAVTGDGVKKFKITASGFSVHCTVPGDVFEFIIKDGAAILNKCRVNAVSYTDSISLVATDIPAAGSHSYTLTGVRITGTGTGLVVGSAATPIEIIVEQIA